MKFRFSVLACWVMLVTVTASVAQTPDITKRRQDEWMRCLKESYRINRMQTSDKNAAAELAFQACVTEEDSLRAHTERFVDRASFAHLKAQTKKVLIDEGR